MTRPDSPALPPRQGLRRMFVEVPPRGRRWPAGVRAALAFGVPALVLLALGHQTEALLTAAGGFAVVYGEGRAFRARWAVVLVAGAALVASAAVGGLVGQYAPAHTVTGGAILVVVLAVTAVIGAVVVDALRLGPPGPFFFVLTCAIGSVVPLAGVSWAVNAGCVAIGAAWAAMVSMSPAVRDPIRRRRADPRRAPERDAVAAAERAVAAFLTARDDTARDDDGSDGTAGHEHASGNRVVSARHRAATAVDTAWATLHDARMPARRPDDPLVARLLTVHHTFATAGAGLPPSPDHAADAVHDGIPMARPSVAFRLRRALHPHSHATTTAVRVGVASLVAGGLAVAAGLGRPDWAVVGAVLVLQQGPDRPRGLVRAAHRLAGTALGVVLFAAIFSLHPSGFVLVLILMGLQFLVELVIARNYGIAVVFITPLALLIGGASHPGAQAWPLAAERLLETTIGVACAVAALWVVLHRAHRRCFDWCLVRTVTACETLLVHLRGATVDAPSSMALRRDVQFELTGAALAAEHAVGDDRAWASRQWNRYLRVDTVGHGLLAACRTRGVGTIDPAPWLTRLPRENPRDVPSGASE
ncbi:MULTISPECIES: FUSC family protein [Nocardiaceae]|uniref:FUSC family protein n=1 Tax=Rhodococcoides kroppenstedtii TaxID=293050 RepID=A0ABS7NXD5_9NOCA|nr:MULTISPECIES: FUSC family protein [Rhodococcus]MBY6313447.1 FUSC family protein [Rhodococcus kroppenstedtii]MBY6321547.1 FUSC family protein [Rhodococcus kroppenstedtii]MBY6400245.1 FUSC family protein [Rhodococcus kroppenstedtii]